MKLSISNIAWSKEQDEQMYEYLHKIGFEAIEIAPTRFIRENPYSHIEKIKRTLEQINSKYNLKVSSMQSIWYGQKGNIFKREDVENLISYTKKAIDLAKSIKCNNIVFGCPKNRIITENSKEDDAIDFFRIIGEYALKNDTVIAIEPNPTIYGTNFINYTDQAFEFARKVKCGGVKVNVDLGAIIQNKESITNIFNNIGLINHIHISEPNLEPIKQRIEHRTLVQELRKTNYNKYISIEMKNIENIEKLKEIIKYVKEVFK